jgi:hypothetical protein
MNKRIDLEYSARIEGALSALYSAATPDAAFVANLERQLLAQGTVLIGRRAAGESPLRRLWARRAQPLDQRRWAMGALGLLLAVAVALAAVGPQRVWAEVQRLLGYVPGIGFMDLEETRVLTVPAEVTRDGVTLRVEQVLAQTDGTTVVIRTEGLPPEDQLWPHGAAADDNFDPALRLPDARQLPLKGCTLRLETSTLEFPPLPDDIYRVTLEMPHLPLVPASAAPDAWEVPLTLRPATGKLVTELFPQPYAPPDASDIHDDVTLRVLEVAHSPEETAVRLQVHWPDPDWLFPHIGHHQLPTLHDDLGHVYQRPIGPSSGSSSQTVIVGVQPDGEATPSPTHTIPTHERTLSFAPVSLSARRLTLMVDEMGFDVQAEASFTVDLGDDPQVGDHWPLDVDLEVVGFPIHISGARLLEEEMRLRDGPMQRTLLQFDVDPLPEQAGRTLQGVHLDSEAAAFDSGPGGYNFRTRIVRTSLELREGQPIPTGPIQVRVWSASLFIRGPWTITWAVPGVDEDSQETLAPAKLHPADASQTQDGLTIRVDEVVLTDRLTAVSVDLNDPPPGVTLSRILSWNPATSRHELALEDDRGRRYELSRDVYWQPPGETGYDAGTLTFQPVQPLARRLTLRAPAVEATLPGTAAFDIAVPSGLTMTLGRPDLPWLASASWDVDVPLEIAGYRPHFTEARLEDLNGTTLLTLISDPYKSQQGARWLFSLRLASVTAPDGRTVDLETARSGAGPEEEGSTTHRAVLAFDVVDPETRTVQPGRYHVELDGVTVAVQGPWKLTWRLFPTTFPCYKSPSCNDM